MKFKHKILRVCSTLLLALLTGCRGRGSFVLPETTRASVNYLLVWWSQDHLQLRLQLPPDMILPGAELELLVSDQNDLRPVLYRQRRPIETDTVTFVLDSRLFPENQTRYWQAFWYHPSREATPVPVPLGPVATRIIPSRPKLIRPAENDEVPADLLEFLIGAPDSMDNDASVYVLQRARNPEFAEIRDEWIVNGGGATTLYKAPQRLSPGIYTFRVFAVHINNRTLVMTQYRTHTFHILEGCDRWNQGPYAVRILDYRLNCLDKNRHTDISSVIGPPDAFQIADDTYSGMVSLGNEGWVSVELGRCIHDEAGDDLRVYQTVSFEAVQVFVSQYRKGPWVSLGIRACGDMTPGVFSNHCDFDLARGNVRIARFVKVLDRSALTHPQKATCEMQNNTTPGADIDALEAFH